MGWIRRAPRGIGKVLVSNNASQQRIIAFSWTLFESLREEDLSKTAALVLQVESASPNSDSSLATSFALQGSLIADKLCGNDSPGVAVREQGVL